MGQAATRVEPAERESLRAVALDGALTGHIQRSCAELATDLSVSSQTVSRRLQALEEAGLIEREHHADGQLIAITDHGERLLRSEYESYRRLFEGTATLTLHGTVTDGMGEGRHYIALPGYHKQFVERLGYEPFPGTLNLTLDTESVNRRSSLDSFSAIRIDGWEDADRTYGPADCFAAVVSTHDGQRYTEAHAIVPERTHHDEDNLELIAPDKLRTELDLADGDELRIEIGGE